MKEEHLEIVRKEIARAVGEKVNGKIDKLHAILERQNEKTDATAQQLASHLEREAEYQAEIRAHIAEVKPYLEGVAGLKVLQKFLLWVGAGVLAWMAVKNSITFK